MLNTLLNNKSFVQSQTTIQMPNKIVAIKTINKQLHKELTILNIPRRIAGSKLGLRKRLSIIENL